MRTDRLAIRRAKSERSVTTTLEFALGVGVTMIAVVVIWLLSSSLEISYTREELISLLPSLVGIIIATISLYLSYHVLKEQQKTRLAGTDPVILVHLGQRDDAPLLIMLNVSNVGAGAATNVRIHFEDDVVQQAFQAEKTITNLAKLKVPIRVIPQDTKVSYPLQTFPTLNAEPSLPELKAIVTYEDVDGGRYSSEQFIDIQELRHQSAQESPIAIIANSVKKMHKAIEKITSDSQEFFVVTQNVEKYRDELKKSKDELSAMLRMHKAKEGN